jgi:hypothetical protein
MKTNCALPCSKTEECVRWAIAFVFAVHTVAHSIAYHRLGDAIDLFVIGMTLELVCSAGAYHLSQTASAHFVTTITTVRNGITDLISFQTSS